jgi:hypothetical protein
MTTTSIARSPSPRGSWGIWLLALAALLGVALTLYYEVDKSDGIHDTQGLTLVIVSTILMLLASLVIALWVHRGWLHGLLAFLIILDIVGTAAAGYFLESYALAALMLVALIGWLAHVFAPARRDTLAGVTP